MEPPAGDAALPPPPPSSSVIFLGTGCSGALPDTRCLLRPSAPPCAVCSLGVSLPPEQNPNYRNKVSCGKEFGDYAFCREFTCSHLVVYSKYRISEIEE
ncbi:hypothetical protein OsJ_11871 [Oryza sativa Japonica Group]|uniref:Uncharacterized protein n=1 Tax=Oryza sativa subsp. japonica TaxID=39947 RepID=B9F9X6_ORYSJ|nr:hypothetical protein OsJ_11871 [Oryza sativa Japonica Group]